jgi:hypothetical protein
MQASDFQNVLDFKPQSWSALKKIQKARADLEEGAESQEPEFLKFTESEQEELRGLKNRNCVSSCAFFEMSKLTFI